ncbi:MAG: aldehyde dehydrogenase family protein [Betaproteobacteria bacterium]|nr:aldehyde dehydrogenase family protein [Betaproteobacteria bacterium]
MDVQFLVELAQRTGTLPDLPTQHFIDGHWCASAHGAMMDSWDPGTGKVFLRFAAGGAAEVDAAVDAARRALGGPWSRLKPAERAHLLRAVAAGLRAQADVLAVAETLDSGKRLAEAQGDVRSAAACFDYYAGACDKFHGDTLPLGPDYLAYTVHEPIGVTAHVIPWNYPLSTAARGIAPALAAGCTVVAKPAEQTPVTALLLAQIIHAAGLPPGVVNVVTGTGSEAGAALVGHAGVDHVTFTGSVATGVNVMRNAADQTTRLLLELGGKSPLLVLADADMDRAVEGVMDGIFENAGQICSAASRLVIDRHIHAGFMERLLQKTRALTLGHGLRNAGMGPVNSAPHLHKVSGFLERARSRGAQILCGGNSTTDPQTGLGWFFEPTIVDDLRADDELVQEEIFGPVLAVQIFDDLEQALDLANGTRFGLVAGIYTRDFSNAHRLAQRIDAGQVYINEYFAGGIALPFGGNKRSGFGREKGMEALRSYSKLKSV